MVKEFIKIAIKSLRTRPIRSWLTMIGVVIGVFLIVSLLSLSEGVKGAILQELRMMGKDLVLVFPGEVSDLATTFGGGLELSENDIKAVEKADGVESVVPMNYKAEAVRHEGTVKTILINGVSLESGLDVLQNDFGWTLKAGEWPVIGKKEVIVGNAVPNDIFPGMEVGDEVTINGKKFNISGILESVGNKQDDSTLTADLDMFKEITGETKGAKMIIAKVKEGYNTDNVVENIKENLTETRKRVRGSDSPPFSVLSSEKVAGIVNSILGMIQAAIIGFASIAIVVGGIGIMNTMYMSVHERIREIGIMKAVGARNKTITLIFLIESGIFGLFGGAGGILLGIIFAKIIETYFQFHPVLYLRASVSPGLILFSLAFSFLLGCISGYLPSRSAAKMNPVEALRYE
jgi:putative ABC transport system permease protein